VTAVAAPPKRGGAKYEIVRLSRIGTMARRQSAFDESKESGYALPRPVPAARVLRTKVRADSIGIFNSLSWRDFERLIGDAFRGRGFTVTGFGGGGPDRGVDLGLMKNGERFLVQCKNWRTPEVGVMAVRELDRVVAALGANGGYVVTAGRFTREARAFAEICEISLIDGPSLEALIGHVAC
jgi:HJR/Mrr/RecB family endonuclease